MVDKGQPGNLLTIILDVHFRESGFGRGGITPHVVIDDD